jgi:hypothetical protein
MTLSPYATRPYCLDSEFLPRSLLSAGIDGLTRDLELARADAAHREFIRALIFSPQVLVGRESCGQHPILVAAARDDRASIEKLLETDRLNILLTRGQDKQGKWFDEGNLPHFLKETRFPLHDDALPAWTPIAEAIGDEGMRYVKLSSDQSNSMERRYTDFFNSPPDDPNIHRVFRDSLGSQTENESVANEKSELFRSFWEVELELYKRWLKDKHKQHVITRGMIYGQFIRPNSKSQFHNADLATGAASEKIRALREPLKLVFDLAYNANTPAELGIKSFVPPELPDPVGLPSHLFQSRGLHDPKHAKQAMEVYQACKELIDLRIDAHEQFFYEIQEYESLPDIGSFTLSDAVEVMHWDEWKAFRNAQEATMSFESAGQLQKLIPIYAGTIKQLHEKLASVANHRDHWRRAAKSGIALCVSVAAHVMGHALLPDYLHHAPWWATVVSATAFAKPIHMGLDILIHGVEKRTGRLLIETGWKDGGMREFTLSDEMKVKLEKLYEAEQRVDKDNEKDLTASAAAANIATEG